MPQRDAVPAKGQVVMAGERYPHRYQPAENIGLQRAQTGLFHQTDHGQPMDDRRGTANGDKTERARDAMQHAEVSVGAGMKQQNGDATVALCVCADDCGLDAGVNAAIMRLVEMQRVHATGVLVGAPAWRAAATWLRQQQAGALDVGLHLDFTEYPLAAGMRHNLSALIRRCWLGALDAANVRAEIRAQLDAFEDRLGRAPDFVDGHQHVHQFPVIREALLAELLARYPGARPWLRATRCRLHPAMVAGVAGACKAQLIEVLGAARLAALARQHGFVQNAALLGVYGFSGGQARYVALLRGWLALARKGDVLMCHPGRAAASGTGLALAREAEFQVLSGVAFADWVAALGLQLRPLRQHG